MHEAAHAALPLLVPLLYLLAAAAPARLLPGERRWRLARLTAAGALAAALAAAGALAVLGPGIARGPALPLGPLGALSPVARLDGPGAVMLVLVTAVAAVILRFSERYLAGQGGRDAYLRGLLATLAAATVLVATNDLLVLALAWTASSLALHRLLTFFADRPQALIAAHKKFLLSRVADACILAAVALITWSLGTRDIEELLARAALLTEVPPALSLGGLLLVAGVLLRSAQLPFHGWLIQVMEAPTPVSALLHAGIVNIGGFVMIRLAPLMSRLDAAQTLLVVAGTATAVLAGLVMTTRVSVKVALAWSTAAQMGFMLVECGVGAPGLALLHLVAHSLYKAHAFLSSGSAVEAQVRRAMTPSAPRPGPGRSALAALAAAVLVLGTAAALGVDAAGDTTALFSGVLLALAVAPLLARASLPVAPTLRLFALGAATGLALLHAGWHHLFDGVTPVGAAGGEGARVALALGGFLALFALQTWLAARPHGTLAQRLHPHCYAGFYLDEVFTRLTFKLWPPRAVSVGAAGRRGQPVSSLEAAT